MLIERLDLFVVTNRYDGCHVENTTNLEQFTVATLDDLVLEGAETFTVSLNASNPLVIDTDTGTGTLTDNDAAAVTVDDITETEGTGMLFTVSLDNAVASAFTVDVTLADVSAIGGAAPLASK